MCGNESTMRIERVGNGFTVDAYTPGGKDKPGTHKRSVATSPDQVLRAVGAHLGKGERKQRRGTSMRGSSVTHDAAPRTKSSRRKSAKGKR